MNTDHENELERSPGLPTRALGTQPRAEHAVNAVLTAVRGSPEGRYLAGPGKPLARLIMQLRDQLAGATARRDERRAAVEHAMCDADERRMHHRGGERTWLLRLLIVVGILAESLTAYVAMEVLVASQVFAVALAGLAAIVGTGMACLFANRRLDNMAVPTMARSIEASFVAVLTVLRYVSLSVQGAGLLAAVGSAAFAALISTLGLLGIEEVVVETKTLDIFVSGLRVAWKRRRFVSALANAGRIQARADVAAENLQQHFMDFLLKTEGLSVEKAEERAAVLRDALSESDVAI